MTFPTTDPKDPDDVEIYTWEFDDYLDTGESISSATAPDFPSGLTLDAGPTVASPDVSMTISGGTAGESYDVTCRAVTDGGRTKDITLTIPVAET